MRSNKAGMNWLNKECEKKNELFLLSLFATFAIGLIAHGYAFLNSLFSHDSLYEMYILDSASWKISLGRYLNPLQRYIFGDVIALPWLNGLMSLFLIAVASWLTVRLFSLSKRWQVIAISGIFVTNIAVYVTIATFITDLVPNSFALVAAITAALCWEKQQRAFSARYFAAAVALTVVTLALYQSYISVTIVAMILLSIWRLIDKAEPKKVFVKGVVGILMVTAGAVIYLLSVKTVCLITDVELVSGRYNSLTKLWDGDNNIFARILPTYKMTVKAFVNPAQLFNVFEWWTGASFLNFAAQVINIALFVLSGIAFIRVIIAGKGLNKWAYVMIALLLVALPPVLNMTYIATGIDHELTRFVFCFAYVAMIMLSDRVKRLPAPRKSMLSAMRNNIMPILLVCITLLIFQNVRMANAAYLKRDLEKSSTLSVMTCVISAIEATEGYELGKTTVAFVGNPGRVQNGEPGFGDVNTLLGFDYKSQITSQAKYKAYFANILQYPITLLAGEEYEALLLDERVAELPIFPEAGSVTVIDDVVVVKMS